MRLHGFEMPAAEVMVCGSASTGSYTKAQWFRVYLEALRSCGRLRVTDQSPHWAMEEMLVPRVMSDMLLLPDGNVLIINGATNRTAGWEDATSAIFNQVSYLPEQPDPSRRYRVLSQGWNPVESLAQTLSYSQKFAVHFVLMMFGPERGLSVGLLAPPFTTHSLGMNQRLLFLEVMGVEHLSGVSYKVTATVPPGPTVNPPGYYLLFVVHGDIPSRGVWVKVQSD